MEPFEYIQILSTLIWLIVPFRRIYSKHFYFFLFLGLNDFLGTLLWYVFGLSSQILWIPLLYLTTVSIDRNFFAKNLLWISFGFITLIFLNFYSTTYLQYIFSLLTDIIILVVFIRYLFWGFIKINKVSIFYTVMTFYALFSISKSILMVGNIYLGINAFYVGTVLQIVIGLYLIFVRRDVKISLKF